LSYIAIADENGGHLRTLIGVYRTQEQQIAGTIDYFGAKSGQHEHDGADPRKIERRSCGRGRHPCNRIADGQQTP